MANSISATWDSSTPKDSNLVLDISAFNGCLLTYYPTGKFTGGTIFLEASDDLDDAAPWFPVILMDSLRYRDASSIMAVAATKSSYQGASGWVRFRARLGTPLKGNGSLVIRARPISMAVERLVAVINNGPSPAGLRIQGAQPTDVQIQENPVLIGGAYYDGLMSINHGEKQNVVITRSGSIYASLRSPLGAELVDEEDRALRVKIIGPVQFIAPE